MVVMIFPSFKVGKEVFEVHIDNHIKKLGFRQVNPDQLLYGRPGQNVYRDVRVFRLA